MSSFRRRFHPLALSLFSGIIFTVSWPPYGFPFLAMIAFFPLFQLGEEYASKEGALPGLRVFGYSFLAFLTWNIGTTWWIFNSSSWGSLFAFVFNAMFMATVFRIFWGFRRKEGPRVYMLFPFFWIAFEFLHINWDLSWPWLTLGHAFSSSIHFIQWIEYTGTLGLSLWILLTNVVAFNLYVNWQTSSSKLKTRNGVLLFLFVALPIGLSLSIFYGTHPSSRTVNTVVVQPNLDPYLEKFNGTGLDQLSDMLRNAESKILPETHFVVLPETALSDQVSENQLTSDTAIQMLYAFTLAHPNITVLTGMSSYKLFNKNEERTPASHDFDNGQGFYEAYNSALTVDSSGNIKVYHKSKLVIGVEKIPYPIIFGYLEKFAIDLGGTSGSLGTQKERTVFKTPHGNVAPVICYESVYGDFLKQYIENGAEFFAVITNDGWWGDTPGYHQHIYLSQMRAIEFRRAVVRSANTGISGFINSKGELSQATTYWTPAVINGDVELNTSQTLYSRFGDYIGWISAIIALASIVTMMIRRKATSITS